MPSQDLHIPPAANAGKRRPLSASELADRNRIGALLFAVFAVTIAIIYGQIRMRSEVFDPHSLRISYLLFTFQDYAAAWAFLGVVLLAAIPKVQHLSLVLADWIGSNLKLTAALTTVGLALGARFAYHAYPLSMDEYAPYFQSQLFASGHLIGHISPELLDWVIPPGFQNYFLQVSHRTGEVASTYWPGFALLLTPFTAIGLPWLANPVIGGATVLAVGALARELLPGTRNCGLAVLFTIASAAVLIDAISFYSMSAHLLFNACYALLLLKPSPKRALLAGLIGSWALVLHNPVPHVAFAIPWIVWILFSRSDRWSLLGALIAGYLPLSLLLGVGWPLLLQGLKDDPQVVAAAAASTDLSTVIAQLLSVVGKTLKMPSGVLLEWNLIALGKLWLWATPALLLLAIVGIWKTRREAPWLTVTASALLTLFVYLFVPFDQGHGWGDRYFHSVWFVLPLMSVAAVRPRQAEPGNVAIERYVAGAALLSLILLVPLRLYQSHDFISGHLAQLPEAKGVEPAVLVVNPALGYYPYDLIENDPNLKRRPLKLLSHGRKTDDQFMARHFPELRQAIREPRGSVWALSPPAANEP